MRTVTRSWTVATWLVAGIRDDTELIGRTLAEFGADAVALQSIGHHQCEDVATALGMSHEWSRSHFPRSRLFPGSALGLAVLAPHRIGGVDAVVTSRSSSTWSTARRIMQVATVERSDATAYRIRHAVDHLADVPGNGAPLVTIRPARSDGSDPGDTVGVPDAARVQSVETRRPDDRAAALVVVQFEMPWVEGDYPTNVR